MEHSYGAKLNQLQLKPLGDEDLEFLRQWRNDKIISKYFRKIDYISVQQQTEWYQRYLSEEGIYYWSITKDGKVIGALSIYNYNLVMQSAEIGKIMIGDPIARGKGYGYQSLIMAMKIGIDFLKLKFFNLNVHEHNLVAFSMYKKAGFEIVGAHPFDKYGNEYEMQISSTVFKEDNPMHNNIVVYSATRGV